MFFCLLILPIHALDGEALSKKFRIPAGAKISKQWIRIFKSERSLKRYGIVGLSQNDKDELLNYLIDHAADSDYPLVPGF